MPEYFLAERLWSSGAAGAQVPYKHKVGGSNPSSTTIEFKSPINRWGFFHACIKKAAAKKASRFDILGVPWRIRISVAGLRSRCPWPLDEGGVPILARPIAPTANARAISANGAKAAQTHLRIINKHPHAKRSAGPNLGPKPPAPC